MSTDGQSINTHKHTMKTHTTKQGNHYWIDGIFAFINIGGERLTYWEDIDELENWINSQY